MNNRIVLKSLHDITNSLSLIIFLLALSISSVAQEAIDYSVFLIGDTGEPLTEEVDPVFHRLSLRLQKEDKNAAIIFLGDNVYHNGLPPEDHDKLHRKRAEKKLLVQLEAIEDFKGKIYFIPGNHDWNDGHADGIDYIRAQEEFIEFYLDRGDVLIPDHGCPGPEKKKLGKNVVLIALDSQWWLHPHDDADKKNATCRNKNVEQIITELKEMLDEEDDKQIIIALHHPIYSDGSHNGSFPLRDHIFPLTLLNSKLFIPLPVIGSLYPFYRTAFGVRQDMPHPLYQELRERILEAIAPYKNVVLASGHEHNQQYFYKHENHFVKSGSGSKSEFLPALTQAIYSTEEKGYAKLEYYKDGQVRLRYFIIDDNGNEKEDFNKIIVNKPLQFNLETGEYDVAEQQIKMPASSKYESGAFHKFIFGSLYRDDWSTPTSFRSINLSKEKGGLRPLKVGGGYSSKSIRFGSESGDQYVLRSIEKGVTKVVPPEFQNTLVQDIFQDQISGSQPYGAVMVAPLADAVGVYHTNPEIVYLPDQPILGAYGKTYGNALYLFEERPYKDEREEEDFGNSKKIISYTDLLERLQDHSKHSVRQSQVLKSRIFDFYLGDWDRHDDQWRWARFKEKNYKGSGETHSFYEPIPRDRDQVFYKYKGLIPSLTKLFSPITRKFQNFDETIKNVPYLAYNARYFDRSFLNQMDRSDWAIMAKEVASSLTDDAIDESINTLPEEIQNLRKNEYQKILRSRRHLLVDYADEYYTFLAKYVDVVGTREKETFTVERLENGNVYVTMHQRKKGGKLDDLMYERTFIAGETKEVRLYGLQGKDVFNISGSHKGGPLIRIIGGKGKDVIHDTSILKGGKKSVVVYDTIEDNNFELGTDASDKRSDIYSDNQYNREEFYYNEVIGLPFVGTNPDDGLALRYVHSASKYGFRKSPYGVKHDFRFGISTARKELLLGYDFHAVDFLKKIDFKLETDFFLPNYVANFFGLSNEIRFNVESAEDFDFYRYKQEDIRIRPSLEWSTKRGVSRLQLGPFYRRISSQANVDKFVSQPTLSELGASDFASRNYLGIRANYRLYKVDDVLNPSTGVDFSLTPSYNINVSDPDESFAKLEGSLVLYNFLFIPRPFVLATKFQFGINWGNFGFTQANYLGRNTGMRSFYNNRFGGRSSFSVSNDLRLKMFKIKKGVIPFSFGLIGSLDHGRVWADGEQSGTWHTSYGGGFWISPFDVAPISVYYMTNVSGAKQIFMGLGFAF